MFNRCIAFYVRIELNILITFNEFDLKSGIMNIVNENRPK